MKDQESRSRIIELVKKLLAMTEDAGCTEAEALAFALRAQRLIAEYGISEAELRERGGEENIETVSTDPVYRQWGMFLADVVARNFRCRSYVIREERQRKQRSHRRGNGVNRIAFYGYAADATAASITFGYLYRAGHDLAVDRRTGRKLKGDEYKSFTFGFVEGVSSELEKQSMELMLVVPKAVNEKYEELSRNFRKGAPLSGWREINDYTEDGRVAGRDSVKAGRIDGGSAAHLLADGEVNANDR